MKKFNIGLDIGTNSVGWAVTNEYGDILKLKGRHMWGVRLFNSADTAEERRKHRSASRRLERRKERIRMLQELMAEDICAEFPSFYNDLKLSKYHKDDGISNKNLNIIRKNKYNLFSDKDFTDIAYYKKYHTIYDLRNELCKSKEKIDIRLVYLAIHHIIKYRGNFLYQGEFKISETSELKEKIKEVLNVYGEEGMYTEKTIEDIFESLENVELNEGEKVEKILKYFSIDADIKKKIKGIFSLIVGKKEKLSKIFDITEDKSIKLTDDYDETEIEGILGEEYYYFEILKEINSWYTLKDILKENKNGDMSISNAFIEKYKNYKSDLKYLKTIYKKYLPNQYSKMFRRKVKDYANYSAYESKDASQEDFYKMLKKELKDVPEKEKKYIFDKIDNEKFLVRLNTRDNGAIPYQLHKIELIKIIENQSKYYKCLEKNKDKIISLLTFKIPYYVGPLNSKDNSARNWSIRYAGKENEKVYPWNFDEVIDRDATANEFIKRMTNKCTYFPKEDVIPQNSLLYSEFCVLNELNNVRYNGKHFSKEEKQKIIDCLFKEYKTVSKNRLKKFLEAENQIEIEEITGLQKENEFASSLTSYIDFSKDIFDSVNQENYEMIEQIIEWITVFEDKDILERKLKNLKDKNGNEILTSEQQRKILKKNYSGWSRLSKKLLTGIWYTNEYGQRKNVMNILRDMDFNLMQIINNKTFGFDKQIEEAQKEIENKKINYSFYKDNIDSLAGSPAIKRGIWQTIKVVDELVYIMKSEPENIFIEFAREEGKKERTQSRKSKIQKSYDKFCNENPELINKDLRKHLKNITEREINDRLYLYYMQNGKCMYTGKPLNINDLEVYQIDHIIPQSKIKDDSFDNKVLVYASENQKKSDGFIKNEIISKQKENWKRLYEAGLISQVKYYNLINNIETDKRIEGFIKRQLVETRQITKHVTKILQTLYSNSSVYAIKALLGHEFRNKYDILKIREMNNYHHAHDAYITTIIGNSIIKKYPKMLKEFVYKDYIKDFKKEASDIKGKNENKYGFIINNMGKGYTDKITGEIISDSNEEERIKKILKTFDVKDVYITKKLEENTGAFYDQNAKSAKYAETMSNPIEIKKGLVTSKYGSYNSEKSAYYILVKYTSKGNEEYKIIGLPAKEKLNIQKNEEKLIKYLKVKLKSNEIKILKQKILGNQLIYKQGKPYYLISDKEIKIAKELRVDASTQKLLHILLYPAEAKVKEYINALKFIDVESETNVNVLKEDILDFYECQKQGTVNEDKIQKYKIEKSELEKIVKEKALIKVYDELTTKIKLEYFESVGENLEKLRNNYLKNEEKIEIIKLLLKLTKGERINLEKIGGNGGQGRISKLNMNENWLKDVKFIEQSVTGIYKKEYTMYELENCNNI